MYAVIPVLANQCDICERNGGAWLARVSVTKLQSPMSEIKGEVLARSEHLKQFYVQYVVIPSLYNLEQYSHLINKQFDRIYYYQKDV